MFWKKTKYFSVPIAVLTVIFKDQDTVTLYRPMTEDLQDTWSDFLEWYQGDSEESFWLELADSYAEFNKDIIFRIFIEARSRDYSE